MVSKEDQLTYKGIAAGVSSGLSMIGSVYILGRYWYGRRVKARATGANTVHHVDVTKELIHVLAWLDLIGAVGRCFGVLPTQTYDWSNGEKVTSVCQLQAYVITFGDVAPIAWNYLMALNLYRWVCRGEDQQMLQHRIKWYVVATLVFTLAIDTLALGFNKYGAAGQWCWISVPGNRSDELLWKLITLYAWVLIGAVAMIVLLVMVKMNVRDRLKGVDNDDARVAYQGVVQNLTIYIVAFIVCWCPAVLDRGYSTITGHDVFTLSMLHTSIVPLQGFVNAVIYGKFHVWIHRHIRNGQSGSSVRKDIKSIDSRRSTEVQESERRQFGTASIFVTSFDMNWSPFPSNLNDWIPPNKDLYVFSLQHCLGVQDVEQSIRKHLLQVNYPMGYRSITSLSGSMVRGTTQDAAVCQIVFVNNSDIASGNFQFQTADGHLWSQRKVFKGVVGMPMRYFEASLAFVSCDLSPISSQPSPEISLASKHAALSTLLHSFEMDADRAAVDFPYLYHHTILSGNLNYSIDAPRTSLTTSIDQAYKAECLKRATDTALNTRLRNFGQSPIDATRSASVDVPIRLQPVGTNEPGNSNVNVEWNLLYFKTRGSLGRASYSSNSSVDDTAVYEEVFSASHDGLPFTQLKSPARIDPNTSFVPASRLSDMDESVAWNAEAEQIEIDVTDTQDANITNRSPRRSSDGGRTWLNFLNDLFLDAISSKRTQRSDTISNPRGESKKISDWMIKSQLVAESCQRKWQEVLRQDELRAAIEAKDILCGFEEPPIKFLPSYPRRVGVAASYSMLAEKNCKEFFAEGSDRLPAYKDRILVHSLPDTRQRIRNVGYWLCEEIITSTHKPVCSLLELEIDRFFSYKNTEADALDLKEGKLTLKEKTDIQEYKIKLVNLDANIWTYVTAPRPSTNPLWRLRTPLSDENVSDTSDHASNKSAPPIGATEPDAIELRSVGSLSNMLEKIKGRKTGRASNLSTGSASTRRGRLDSLNSDTIDLIPIEPTSIATVFPLPSEDVYALQRKIHEVAHSVQRGFQASAHNEQGEEASLAYTNFRTVLWKEAVVHGVMHSAITKAVNGVIHVAIKIEGDTKTQGGQGILCIQERDLISHAAASIGDAEPIPFDLPLTWGGQHVGYLHGDILSGL